MKKNKQKDKKEYFIISSDTIEWSEIETPFDINEITSNDLFGSVNFHLEIPQIIGNELTTKKFNHKEILKTKKLSDLILLIESEGFYQDDYNEQTEFIDYLYEYVDYYKICCHNKTKNTYSICKTENIIDCYVQMEEMLTDFNSPMFDFNIDVDNVGFDEKLYKSSFKNLELALRKCLGDKFNFGVVYCSNNLVFDVNKNNKGEISYGTFFTHHEKIKRDIALILSQDIAMGFTFKVYTKGKDISDKEQFFEVYGFALINKENVDYVFDIMNISAEETKQSYQPFINEQPDDFKNYVFSDLDGNRIII
jgi:hypothetical protein